MALLIIGIILYILSNLNREYAQGDFTWKGFFFKHIQAVLISLLLGISVLLTTDYGSIIGEVIEKLGDFTYLVIGYFGQSIFVALIEVFDSEIKTKWGRNKK